MNTCKNICEQYRKVNYKRMGYRTGKVVFCKSCHHMFHKEDVVKYRCPCCNGKVRMHIRGNKRKEIQNIVVKRY